jgi:hypothetical protein
VVNAMANSPKNSEESTRKKSPGIKKTTSIDRFKKLEQAEFEAKKKVRRTGVSPDPRIRMSVMDNMIRPSLYDKGILKFQQ